jgi:hypothetical protein
MYPDNLTPTREIVDGLKNALATVWRWGFEGSPEYVCLATDLGRGRFAVAGDAGIRNPWGSSYGPFSDLYISMGFCGGDTPSDLIPARSVYECPLTPICLLTLDLDTIETMPTPAIATMGDMERRRNSTVWRIGFSRSVFPDQNLDPSRPAYITNGYTNQPVANSQFRGATDPLHKHHSPVVDCCLDYPGRSDFGAPICDDNGRLAGVLVGNDTASGYTHIGFYMPVEIILPFIELDGALSRRSGGVFGIHEGINHTRA